MNRQHNNKRQNNYTNGNSTYQTETRRLEEENKKLREEINESKKTAEKYRELCVNYSERLKRSDAEVNNYQGLLKDLKNKQSGLNQQVDQFRRIKENEVQEINKNFNKTISSLRNDNKELEQLLTSAREDNQKLQSKQSKHEQQINQSQHFLALKESEVQEYKNQLEKATMFCENLKDKLLENEKIQGKQKQQNDQLRKQIDKLQQSLEKLEFNNEELRKSLKGLEFNNVELCKSLEGLEFNNEELCKSLEESESKNERLQQSVSNYNNSIKRLEDELNELQQKNILLEDEASKYQSALGVATNFQLDDDDQNHAVKLNQDIADLNDKIKEYITNLKGNTEVDIEKVKELLTRYKCSTKIKSQKEDRMLIQAVMQRHVMETIFNYAIKYFNETELRHYHLEADIIRRESLLSEVLAHASKYRSGNDEISNVGPIKLRQQVYSILSNRGFADIVGSNDTKHEHPLINHIKNKLNESINELRTIKIQQKREDCENLAVSIIRDVIMTFWFRFKVHEPAVQYLWIPNDIEVDKSYMEGNNFDENENYSYVDLCYFPLIGRDLDSNNRKVYTSAKVLVKSRKSKLTSSSAADSTIKQRKY